MSVVKKWEKVITNLSISYRTLILCLQNVNAEMEAKIKLSFDQNVIEKAKDFAATLGISLSRLTEFLYEKLLQHQKHR